jgi:hypothetical protein
VMRAAQRRGRSKGEYGVHRAGLRRCLAFRQTVSREKVRM